MTIGQLSKTVGISASTIRFYESAGILRTPDRKNGIRDYDASTIEELRILIYLRNSGVSVRSLSSKNLRPEIERRIDQLNADIARSQAMKAQLEEVLACACNGERQHCIIFAS